MKYVFIATLDTVGGSYDAEFRNTTDPEAGVDYEHLRAVLDRVLADLDRRMGLAAEEASKSGDSEVHVMGDDVPLN